MSFWGLSFFPFFFSLLMLTFWVVLLVAVWRFMRAHESIAESYKSMEGMMTELVRSMKGNE